VKLRPEDVEKLQKKQLANVIVKLNSGKTLTAREQRMIEESRAGIGAHERENFVTTWHDLASRLGRTRRTLQDWRERFKDAKDLPPTRYDGQHDVAAWLRFMAAHNLIDEPEPELSPNEQPKAHWDRERARIDFERAVYNFEVERKKHVSIDEISAAVGQMLAGFRTALNMLPGSAARWLIGLRDFHAIKGKLQSEVDGVLQALGRCRYLEGITSSVVDRLFSDRSTEFRGELTKCVDGVYRELGRLALQDLLQTDFDAQTQTPGCGNSGTPEQLESSVSPAAGKATATSSSQSDSNKHEPRPRRKPSSK
jgi:hypothetical protein